MKPVLFFILALLSPCALAQVTLSFSGCATTGTQYAAYTSGCSVVGAGGVPPYTYSWNTLDAWYSALPVGLTLNTSTGTITGTLYEGGKSSTQIIVTDSHGTQSAQGAGQNLFTLAVAGNNVLTAPLFPSDSIFHTRVDSLPVDTSPVAPMYSGYTGTTVKAGFGGNIADVGGGPNGIPFEIVPSSQANVTVGTCVGSGSCFQSYFTSAPWPSWMGIESTLNNAPTYTYDSPNWVLATYYGQDAHCSIVQLDGSGNPLKLWEGYGCWPTGGQWVDASNAYWSNLQSTGANAYQIRASGQGSADAAGLPIAPLLLTAEEVIGTGTPTAPNGVVQHPTRFTASATLNYHVWPATQQAGLGGGTCSGGYVDPSGNYLLSQLSPPTSCGSSTVNPMGEIYRLKSSVSNPSCAATSPQTAIIIQGLRNYGMMLADNGLTGFLGGTPDSRWNDGDLSCLMNLHMGDFEPVNVQSIAVNWPTSSQTGVPAPVFQMNLCGDTSSSSACTPSTNTSTRDISGGGNNGTWNGTQSGTSDWYSAGLSPLPYAGHFNGTDNFVNLGNSSTLNPTNNFSMTAWVNFASLPAGEVWFISRDDASLGQSFNLGWDGAFFGWWEWNVNGYSGEPYTNSIPIMVPTVGQWYFVAVTGSSSTGYTMSINAGAPTIDSWVAPATTTGNTVIGEQTYAGVTDKFNGRIEDVRIYNSVLTQSQIAAIYNAVLPQSGTPTFSVASGTYGSTQSVTLSATGGSVICYSTTPTSAQTDGASGCINSTKYTGAVSVPLTETLYAVSGGTGYGDSPVGIAAYKITGTSAMNVVQTSSCGADQIAYGTNVCVLSPTQAGNSLLLGCLTNDTAITSTVPASVPLMTPTNIPGDGGQIWTGLVSGVSTGTTSVTFNGYTGNKLICEAVEVSGLVTTSAQDGSASGITGVPTPTYGASTGSVTTSNANDAIVAFAMVDTYKNNFTAGTGYTLIPPPTYYGNATTWIFAMEYQNVSSTGSYNPGMTWLYPEYYGVGTVALKLQGSSGGGGSVKSGIVVSSGRVTQ